MNTRNKEFAPEAPGPFLSTLFSANFFYGISDGMLRNNAIKSTTVNLYPRTHLAGYQGLMQADAYAGFSALYEPSRKPGPIIEQACWAHARRAHVDLARLQKSPIAIEIIKRIDAIIAIEHEINGKPPEHRRAVRQERSAPLVTELESYMRETYAKLSPKGDPAKAIAYSLNRWPALTRCSPPGAAALQVTVGR